VKWIQKEKHSNQRISVDVDVVYISRDSGRERTAGMRRGMKAWKGWVATIVVREK
jgi:hypothetical protein